MELEGVLIGYSVNIVNIYILKIIYKKYARTTQ